MKDEDIVIGQTYRVKTGLPQYCWNDIYLDKPKWESLLVTVTKVHERRRKLIGPDGEFRRAASWVVRRKNMPSLNWLPAYALESPERCMFEEVTGYEG